MTGRPLRHEDAAELLGALALDAVEPDERVLLEDHLRGCPRCRAELAAHRETAAMLSSGLADPPAELWDRVAASLDERPPPLDLAAYRAAPSPRRRWAPIAAAAAAAAVLGLGAVTVHQDREIGRVRSALEQQGLASAALAAFDSPDARHAALRAGDGSFEVRAVVLPDGSGYLLADRLPALAPGKTYQLWAMVEGRPVSAGVLGPRPTVVAFAVADRTGALALSVEDGGGAVEPTLPPAASGLLRS